MSEYSLAIGYRVGDNGCIQCDDIPSDNLISGEKVNSVGLDFNITNFPNPFNPITKIVYSIPQSEKVKITVYNSLGQVIKELVNEFKHAGNYLVEFNGSNISSGIYFYKIEAGSYTKINRMILLK